MKKSTKKILIGSGALAGSTAIVGIASYAVIKKLVDIALDRNVDEIINKIMKVSRKYISSRTGMNMFMKVQEHAAEELEKCPSDNIDIVAKDGVKLAGHWRTCANARRIVVAMHGWRSSWSRDFGMTADFFHNNGCHVLYAEQRGQNNSGGEYMGFGLTERYDCLEWVKWVNSQGYGNLPVYLCGISMGAATVLMAAGFNLPENVHGIIADCGYTSPHAIWKHIFENNMHGYYDNWKSNIADRMCRGKIQCSSKSYSCIKAMKNCKVPVLFIHGTDDIIVPVKMTYKNYKVCAAPKRLLIVPDAGHRMSYMTDRKLYEQTVKQFWRDFD